MDKNMLVREFDPGSVWLKQYCAALRLQYGCVVEGVMHGHGFNQSDVPQMTSGCLPCGK